MKAQSMESKVGNKCSKCEYCKDVFGNYIQCAKTGQFIDWYYWNDEEPESCPKKEQSS